MNKLGQELINVNDREKRALKEDFFVEAIDQKGKPYSYKVTNIKLIGAGSSCLVYSVFVLEGKLKPKKMILKQFNPCKNILLENLEQDEDDFLYKVRKTKLLSERSEALKTNFVKAYNKNENMHENFPEYIVKPYRIEAFEDEVLALYEIEDAKSLNHFKKLDSLTIIKIMREVCKVLIELNNKGIVYMDLKPENILYNYKEDRIKLFDFDASVDMSEIKNIKKFYATRDSIFLPPELRNIDDLESVKDYLISPEIDSYMFGANLYYLLMGNDYSEDVVRDREKLINKLEQRSDGLFIDTEFKNTIIDIILTCTEEIDREVLGKRVLDKLGDILDKEDEKKHRERDKIISSAFIINENPLYKYINYKEDKKYVDIALLGKSNLVIPLFNTIFSAVDIADTEIVFNFYGREALHTYESLKEKAPLLLETTEIYLDDEIKSKKINKTITDGPYAILKFHTSEDLDEIKKQMSEHYILILDDLGNQANNFALDLYNKFKDSKEKRIIINYKNSVEEARDLGEGNILLKNYNPINLTSDEKGMFDYQIYREAFEVHRFYNLQYGGEREDIEKIIEGFLEGFRDLNQDFYNLRSSLRSALSIPYKLYECGLSESKDIPEEFYQKVILENKNEIKSIFKEEQTIANPSLRDKMAYMEHHSWNKFMITDGYKKPTDEELKRYAYKPNYEDNTVINDHRNKKDKYHPLISNYHINRKKENIDEIDRISKLIHTCLVKRFDELKNEMELDFQYIIHGFTWNKERKDHRELRKLFKELSNIVGKVENKDKDSETNMNITLSQIYRILNQDKKKYEFVDVYRRFKNIKAIIDILIKRNNPVDYRITDYEIVDAIPLIIKGPVKTLYKPFVYEDKELWKNVMAGIKFYPEKIVYIETKNENIDKKISQIKKFFRELRGQKSLKIESLNYHNLETDLDSENEIIDLTGNSHSQARKGKFAELPYVEYLGFNNWDGDFKALKYYQTKTTLTINEAFFLNNAELTNTKKLNRILELNDYSDELWSQYTKNNSKIYWCLLDILNKAKSSYILSLNNFSKSGNIRKEVGSFIFREEDKNNYPHLVSLLENLKDEKIIVNYEFPVNPGKLILEGNSSKLIEKIGNFISENLENKEEKVEKFKLVKTHYPLDTGDQENLENYYYIISNKLRFEFYIDEYQFFNALDNYPLEVRIKKFNELLESYDHERGKNSLRIFNKLGGQDYAAESEPKANGLRMVRVIFEYGSEAFREFFEKEGNALETYTYFELRKYKEIFDYVALNVELNWKNLDELGEGIENEIDIVCTKGVMTFLISCKQSQIRNDFIYEIDSHAKQFSIDTTPIIITSKNFDDSNKFDRKILKRCESSGVYLIDRKMLDEGLRPYLQNIVDGKKDWKEIK